MKIKQRSYAHNLLKKKNNHRLIKKKNKSVSFIIILSFKRNFFNFY